MSMGEETRSFSDPDTEFELVRSQTPVTVDGFGLHEPTGQVKCESCHKVGKNIDEVPHHPDCPQRFVKSRWWRRHLR